MKELNERSIQVRLMQEKYRHLCIANYTPWGWWECDFLYVTDAGFMVECEIKLSRSDFLADSKKTKMFYRPHRHENKHEQLAKGNHCGPSRFYFVTTPDVCTVEDCPEWAGLMHADPRHMYLKILKRAPKLHDQKVSATSIEKIEKTFRWRYVRLFLDGAIQ